MPDVTEIQADVVAVLLVLRLPMCIPLVVHQDELRPGGLVQRGGVVLDSQLVFLGDGLANRVFYVLLIHIQI